MEEKNTYPFILKNKLRDYDIIIYGKGATSIGNRINDIRDYLKKHKPNYVIIHFGIVDCAPRATSNRQNFFMQLLPQHINGMMYDFISKNRYEITKRHLNTKTSINDFSKHLTFIVESVKQKDGVPIICNIAKTNNYNMGRSYNIVNQIIKYNKLIYDVVKKNNVALVDVYSFSELYLTPDGIHLNEIGNKIIADKIFNLIKRL